VPGQRAGDLDVHTGGAVLARPQLRVVRPGPTGQQGAVDDELDLRVEVLDGGDPLLQELTEDRGEGGDPAGDRRLGGSVILGELGLDMVAPQIGQRDDHRLEQPQHPLAADIPRLDREMREPFDAHRAKIDDLLPGETRSMIHATARSSRIECGNPILSESGPSPR
jgi:hypothetical protein